MSTEKTLLILDQRVETAKKNSKSVPRVAYLDILRCIAIYYVVQAHTLSGCTVFKGSDSLFTYLSASIERVQVPLFFMISGALLLGFSKDHEEINFKKRLVKLYKLRVLERILVPLIGWAGIYHLLLYAFGIKPQGTSLDQMNSAMTYSTFPILHPAGHLWFLFVLLNFYIQLPLYQTFFHNAKREIVLYILVLWFIGNLSLLPIPFLQSGSDPVPNLHQLSFKYTGISLVSFKGYIGYCLLGAFCNELYHKVHESERFRKLTWGIGLTVYVLASVLGAGMTYYYNQHNIYSVEGIGALLTPYDIVQTAAVFLAIMAEGENIYRRFPTVIRVLSDCSYGIYLSHLMFNVAANQTLGTCATEYMANTLRISRFVSTPLATVGVLGVSMATTFIIKKIPGLQRIV